jgi:ATP-dependent DNA helicase RecQ
MLPIEILQSHFGYSTFRLQQEAIINAVLQKKDTLVLMPTGGGKSLCYQIPALAMDGLTVVISPLIALMKDQVDALRLNGISAAFLNSTQNYVEQNSILRKANSKEIKLLYLAPESVFLKKISSFNVSLIAIDEAHCISHWGHDFRPEYLQLAQLKRTMPHVPIIALTATADRLTRKDIVEKLELKNPETFISSFNRANIRYTVEEKKRSFEKLLEFLDKRKGESGIIYCLSRASTETLANDLTEKGIAALPYHAGMDRQQRTQHQDKFLKDEVKIMVATIAFGMGIDKSNVRFVVHMDLPKNIESYYQETGRAGRDGLPSEALLFYSYSDVIKLKKFVSIDGNEEQTAITVKKLEQMGQFGDLTTCRRKFLLNYFDEQTPAHCGNCDVCLSRKDTVDGTLLAQKVLSAVVRLHERFGAGYIIDFLRGSNNAKMQDQHKQMKTFGIGADVSKEKWTRIIRDLINQGYLQKAEGLYPILKITSQSDAVLKGTERVMITKSIERVELQENNAEYEVALLQRLKHIRRELAMLENVPPYLIFSDASLLEVAAYLPHNNDEFKKISGFSEAKIEKYGKHFLNVVTAYCQKHHLTSRIHKKPVGRANVRPERETETKQHTYQLFQKGHSIQQIAETRSLSIDAIESHLTFYLKRGKISIEQIMEIPKVIAIRNAIERAQSPSLTPIKEMLGDNYTYGQIRMVRSHIERENSLNQLDETSLEGGAAKDQLQHKVEEPEECTYVIT